MYLHPGSWLLRAPGVLIFLSLSVNSIDRNDNLFILHELSSKLQNLYVSL